MDLPQGTAVGVADAAAEQAPASAADDSPCLQPMPIHARLRRSHITAIAALCALVAVPVGASLALRKSAQSMTPAAENDSGLRAVRVVSPGRRETSTITLPASIDAFQTTLVYARVSGYLLRWYADIGTTVKEGQKLADIDTPELDQELAQARANLAQGGAEVDFSRAELKQAQASLNQAEAEIARAQANVEFARSSLRRAESLSPFHAIAETDLEETRRDREARQAELVAAQAQRATREAGVATARARIVSREANVNSLEANVRRLEKLQGFKTIVAPFDGVVIRRSAEVGILVTAGSSVSSSELFTIAKTNALRTRIHVPQSLAPSIQIGQKAEVLVPERPDRGFAATVARTARAIDSSSRTLMVELELPNADQALLPGTFAQVVLSVRRAVPFCTIPTTTLLNRPGGIRVAVLSAEGTARLQTVKLGRDYGSLVEVLSGLQGTERVVVNPPDDLADGERLTVAEARPTAAGEERKAGH
jgi:RND family efflux transporter MFP subunit